MDVVPSPGKNGALDPLFTASVCPLHDLAKCVPTQQPPFSPYKLGDGEGEAVTLHPCLPLPFSRKARKFYGEEKGVNTTVQHYTTAHNDPAKESFQQQRPIKSVFRVLTTGTTSPRFTLNCVHPEVALGCLKSERKK